MWYTIGKLFFIGAMPYIYAHLKEEEVKCKIILLHLDKTMVEVKLAIVKGRSKMCIIR